MSGARCRALVALVALLGGVGCGETDAPSPARTTPTGTAAGTTSVPGPTPRIVFRSPQRHGYRLAVPPLVVKRDPDEFTLFFRMNKALPSAGGSEGVEYANARATVNGTFSGFGVGPTSFRWNPKPCYSASMDILRRARSRPGRSRSVSGSPSGCTSRLTALPSRCGSPWRAALGRRGRS